MVKISNWNHKSTRSVWNQVNIVIFPEDSIAEALLWRLAYSEGDEECKMAQDTSKVNKSINIGIEQQKKGRRKDARTKNATLVNT